MPRVRAPLAIFALSLSIACSKGPAGDTVVIPGAGPGIGFDDMLYSTKLHRVVVPAGRTGGVALVDPDALTVSMIGGFSSSRTYDGTYDVGPTSVDEANGLLFVTDRTAQRLNVIAPGDRVAISYLDLLAEPDHVRHVAPTQEVWITEPLSEQIEIVSLPDGADPVPTSSGTVSVPGGPQGLVIDSARKRAYTQLWHGGVVAIDLESRTIVERWDNGCTDSRGLALDASRGFLFCACYDGTTTSLDIAFDGHIVGKLDRGEAPDNIGYNASLGRLYLVGGGFLTMVSVSTDGALSFVAKRETTDSAHCAVADDEKNAWVCSPEDGTLYKVADPYPSGF